jgi:hypothetical protein
MQFDLDDDQIELQRVVRRLCTGRAVIDPDLWGGLADLGVFALLREDSGMRPIDAVLVCEELGRELVPGPLVGSVLAGTFLDDVAAGGAAATVLDRRGPGPWIVDHLDRVDVVLVVDEDGVSTVDATAVTAEAIADPLDPLTPVWLVRDLPTAERHLDAGDAARVRRLVWLLSAALLSGNAAASLDVSVQYAKDRVQFGRAIGSFQAVKHLLADMHAAAGLARVACHAAGVLADDERAVASARVVAGRAAIDNGATCIQVHGGMGFTWEAVPHLHYKRALAVEALHGSIERAAETVARSLVQ